MKKQQEVYHFWFEELTPKQWFIKDDAVDIKIIERFKETNIAASKNELCHWRETPQGALSEIIVLDQFSRNLYRNSPLSWINDPLALGLAQEAIRRGLDNELSTIEKSFLYMPFMHSESLVIHEEALKHFNQPGLENNYEFEKKHKAIIERFGRYPHRNNILGRESSPEEIDFLAQPGSSF